jgi:hypothetical protein
MASGDYSNTGTVRCFRRVLPVYMPPAGLWKNVLNGRQAPSFWYVLGELRLLQEPGHLN